MQGRKKHILLILLLLLIAFVSMQMMAGQNYTEEKTRITVILPKDSQNELYGLLDGIRDQAYDDHVKLDVWYKSRLTEKAFDELVKEDFLEEKDLGIDKMSLVIEDTKELEMNGVVVSLNKSWNEISLESLLSIGIWYVFVL